MSIDGFSKRLFVILEKEINLNFEIFKEIIINMVGQLKSNVIPFELFISNLAKEIIQAWTKDLQIEEEIDILENKIIFLIKLICKLYSYDQTINQNLYFLNKQYKLYKNENKEMIKEYDYKIYSNIQELEKLDIREGEIRNAIDNFIEKKEDEIRHRPSNFSKTNNVIPFLILLS